MARVLMLSTLFPNAAQPNHGVFVETRLRETLALGELEATAIAPVPLFFSSHPIFGRYAAFARAPRREVRHGLDVHHPRFVVVPKIGQAVAPALLYQSALACVRRLAQQGRTFDVIDAHYLYPDGVAAARLGRALRLPVVITARGSDVTQIARSSGPAALIRQAIDQASATVAVCDDLRARLIALGAPAERAVTLRNGVDLDTFSPSDRDGARAALGLSGFTLLSVGALIARKDHALTIRALAAMPDATLLIAGSGPLRAELEGLGRRLGVANRVRFLGEVAHADLARLYVAADVCVLCSTREGWANVLLESMACGTPVVASNVNGAAEVVRAADAGRLLATRTCEDLVETLADMRRHMPARSATRAYAERFGWTPVAAANKALLMAAAAAGFGGRLSPAAAEAARVVYERLASPRRRRRPAMRPGP